LADALQVNSGLTSLNLSQNNLTNFGSDMSGMTALANALRVNSGLTKLDLRANYLRKKKFVSLDDDMEEDDMEDAIRKAVEGREGFVLEL